METKSLVEKIIW